MSARSSNVATECATSSHVIHVGTSAPALFYSLLALAHQLRHKTRKVEKKTHRRSIFRALSRVKEKPERGRSTNQPINQSLKNVVGSSVTADDKQSYQIESWERERESARARGNSVTEVQQNKTKREDNIANLEPGAYRDRRRRRTRTRTTRMTTRTRTRTR